MVGTYLEITLKTYYSIVVKAPHVISGVTNYVPFQMRNIFFFRAIFEGNFTPTNSKQYVYYRMMSKKVIDCLTDMSKYTLYGFFRTNT